MATKPIISVEVDDAKFQQFLELFNSYHEKIAEQPAVWEAFNKEIGDSGEALKDGALAGADALAIAAAQADLIGGHLRDAIAAQNEFTRATRETNTGFQALAKTGGRTAAGIGKAFSGAVRGSVAEMGAGITGVAETAAAALGPVGIAAGAIAAAVGAGGAALKALADAAVTRQRSAFSLGLTPGQEASFGINAQQFMGPEALRAAASAQLNYGNAGPLATLGIDFDKARKESPSDLAYQMLANAVKAAQAQPNMPLENIPAIVQYESLGGQIGDVRNALKMGLPALAAAQTDTQRNAARFELKPKAVAASAALKKSFESAGVAAQSGLINNVSGADPAIAKILGAITGDKAAQASLGDAFHRLTSTVQQHVDPALNKFQDAVAGAAAAVKVAFLPNSVLRSLSSPLAGSAAAAVIDVAKKKGVDPTLALADAIQESGLNPKTRVMDHYADGTPAGYSTGLYQLNENGEGAGMSIAQMLDPKQNASRALSEFANVMRMSAAGLRSRERSFGKEVYKTTSTWGTDASRLTPGEIAALAERPADPIGYAKTVDAIYAAIVKAQRAARTAQAAVKVHVTNSTAARVAVSVNAAAQH